MASAVADVVRLQVDAGIDLVSDGEFSKISYSTYVKDRLTGFDGDTPRKPALDLAPYDALRTRLAAAAGGAQSFKRQIVRRADRLCRRRRPARRPRPSARGGRRSRTRPRRRLRQRRITRAGHRLPGQLLLRHPRGVRRGRRRGDAGRVRGDRRCRVRPAARLPRPGDGAPHRIPGSRRRRLPRAAPPITSRCSTTPPATSTPRRCGCTCAGATTRARTTTTSSSPPVLPIVLAARPSAMLFEAANPRHAHEWQVWADADDPRRQGARARRDHVHVELRRPSRPRGRAARRDTSDRRRRSG